MEKLAGPRGYIEYSRLLISGERGVKREIESVEGRGGCRRICTAIEGSRSGKFFLVFLFSPLFIGKGGGTALKNNPII